MRKSWHLLGVWVDGGDRTGRNEEQVGNGRVPEELSERQKHGEGTLLKDRIEKER